MMNFLKKIIFGAILCFTMTGSAQDTQRQKELSSDSTAIIADTLLDGKKVYKASITAKNDSLSFLNLTDLQEAKQLDEKWLNELYSNNLYDTIYKSVTDLDYEPVDYPDLPTDTLKKRLLDLNKRTPFNIAYNPSLESVIKQYLKNRRSSIERLIGLSHFYFPMFEQEFDNYNIPLEMKYLAIVESALKPKAKSRVGATGLWQFMFTTGRIYGLDVSSYVDERSDPLKSTKAAAEYLSKLYEIYGDWDLALAAYNSGPGNVNKAIRRSGGYKNYWNIRAFLPRETAGYVPAFLATMYIFEYAEEHGFQPEKPPFQYFQVDTVHVKQMISFDHISETTGIPVEQLQFLNPEYKLDIIPIDSEEIHTLRLPKEAIGLFVSNETQIYAYAKEEFDKREKPLPQLFKANDKIRYRVRSGDYLGKIARKYGVRVSQIKRWNGLRSNNLQIGQRLTIYPRNPSTIPPPKPKKIQVNAKGKSTYKVKTGDSLWSIAQKFSGISVQNIKDWNDISGNNLKVGTVLILSQ